MIEKSTIISIMRVSGHASQFIMDKVKRRIYRRGRGSVITADDFSDFGKRAAIDLALSRLATRGTIQRIARGIYHYPKLDPVLGTTKPAVEAIVRAVAGAGRMRLQPTGAHAANLLGLSEQVPMRVVYLTDGDSRHIRVGETEIVFKRATPRNLHAAGRLGGLVVQALRFIGKEVVDAALEKRLREVVPVKDRAGVIRDSLSAPAWIRDAVKEALGGTERPGE
jgi:hypothetical protein